MTRISIETSHSDSAANEAAFFIRVTSEAFVTQKVKLRENAKLNRCVSGARARDILARELHLEFMAMSYGRPLTALSVRLNVEAA
jgi:hypothetical protein